jgi:mercuric ion transport protein
MAVIEQIRASISERNAANSRTVASVGGILAAIGAASCCVIPFALATIGVTGAWIGNFTALAPYQPYFIGLTALFLAGGFYLVYRKPKAACADGSYCARPASSRATKIALWSASVLFLAAVAFPYAAPLL